MSKMFEFESASNKATSGLWKQIERAAKKFRKKLIDTDQLKTIWNEFSKLGRSALDAIALASGVPLSQLRQQYRANGIDPDKLDMILTEDWMAQDFSAATPQQIDESTTQSEQVSKFEFNPVTLAIIGIAALVLFTGFLKR